MKLIVGLGNPGKEYEQTRHNAGFAFVDYLARRLNISFNKKFSGEIAEANLKGEKYLFLKPMTFMNESGRSVQETMRFYKLEPSDLYLAFDDLDLEGGTFKIQSGKYPKVHNGVNSVISSIGTDQINFIRIGVDERSETERTLISGRDYVLQRHGLALSPVFDAVVEALKARDLAL